ncbi:S41 family peptidase [Massilistercora timonensis]|uniref:S41 family peptidase n=1 Tax=Massilistercora timonensis TaxID=2086584 RepID=UPI00320AF556
MRHQKRFWQGALCGALAVLLGLGLVSCAGSLPFLGKEEAVSQETKEKLSGIQALIQKEYIGEVDEDALQTGICQGYVGALGDPYSAYYDEEQTSALMETTQGEYGGIGVVLTQNLDTGVTTASSVYEDSPAMKAGMKDGDIIYQVEGRDVSGMALEEISGSIKGEKGTTVEITVLRGEEREEVTLTITRDTIQAETVKTRILEDEIGYLAISEFDSVTLEQYREGLAELKAQGMEGLIVDLRGNPGGNLDTVCEILDLMLPEGLIVYTEDKDGNRQEFTSDEAQEVQVPLAVLVDGNSASASEIYAGAIQDYGIGQIVGTKTYGKGVVQTIYDLKDGTSLKLTVAEYFTPNGRNIDGEGITPDVEVTYQRDENDPEADNQLDRAVETLQNEMAP